jgi:hypothetical protein
MLAVAASSLFIALLFGTFPLSVVDVVDSLFFPVPGIVQDVIWRLRLPRALWPVPKAYGHVIAFDDTGRIVVDLQDATGAYPETTAVTEADGKWFVQSLHAHDIGWMPAQPGPATQP